MDELLAAYNDITASGLDPPTAICNAMRRRRSSVRWWSHAQSSVVHADRAGLTSSASAARSLRGRLKLHDLVLVARISSLIFLDD
jgi:hypothetical protein